MRDFEECLVYVNHLTAEHRRLEHLLAQSQRALELADCARSASRDSFLQSLQGVRQELERHFAEEEAGGCLDEAALRCPQVAGRIRIIEAEHPELLVEVDRLIADASGVDSTTSASALAARVRSLWHKLRAHEEAENEVLARGFGTIVNGN